MLRLNKKKGFAVVVGGALTLALVAVGVFSVVGVVSASKITAADQEG